MYYRVAIQTNSLPTWKWKSTVLSSLDTLLQFLRLHRALPANSLCIFASPSREDMNEMLLRKNNGSDDYSVTVEQFLRARHLHVWETDQPEHIQQETHTTREDKAPESSQPALPTSRMTINNVPAFLMNPLDRRRQEIEFGPGGDHDCPYTFTLPVSIPEMLAWIKLSEKVQGSSIAL